jgi:hypothetical protein
MLELCLLSSYLKKSPPLLLTQVGPQNMTNLALLIYIGNRFIRAYLPRPNSVYTPHRGYAGAVR